MKKQVVGLSFVVACVLFASGSARAQKPGPVIDLSTYQNDRFEVVSGRQIDTICPGNPRCDFTNTLVIRPGWQCNGIEVLLTGWKVTSLSNEAAVNELSVKLIYISYNPSTGVFQWKVEATAGFENNTDYQLEYGFTILSGQMEYLAMNWPMTNQCIANDPHAGCTSTAIVVDALPKLWDGMAVPLGFALSGFSMRTRDGQFISPREIVLDASAFTPSGSDVEQTLSCTFLGESGGDDVPYECSADSVFIGYDAGWFDMATGLQEVHWGTSISPGGSPRTSTAVKTSVSPNDLGVFGALNNFSLVHSGKESLPLFEAQAGCYNARWARPTGYFDFTVAFADHPTSNSVYFDAYTKCVMGFLSTP